MRKRSVFLSLAFISISVMSVAGQARFAGKVIDVVDGKTVIVDTNAGMMKAELQYLEIPEPEQPMHALVREHLANIALGKIVEFNPVRIGQGITVGKITISGVDLSMQMIRDGAAWHQPSDKSGQSQGSALEYDKNQELARSEKRGVWSVVGLKAPWEIRAEKEEKLRQQEAANRQSHPKLVGVSEFQTANRAVALPGKQSGAPNLDAWADVFAGVGRESVGLQTYSDPNHTFEMIYTSLAFVNLVAGNTKQKVECRAMYVYLNLPNGQREAIYLLGFQAISEDFNFSKHKSSLIVVADKQSIALGSPRGFSGEAAYGVREIFYYKISKTLLKKIANAKNVDLHIDRFSGTLPEGARELFKQLATTTE